MNPFKEYFERKKSSKEYGSSFDPTNLSAKFRKYYGTETRIKVLIDGQVVCGMVGVTTGWKPSFILLPTKRSQGSTVILSTKNTVIGIKLPGQSKYKKV